MKHFCLLALAALVLLTACAVEAPQPEAPFEFYYPANTVSYETGALCAQVVSLEAELLSPEELVRAYLDAAPPANASAAVPAAWTFSAASLDGSTFSLRFTGRRVTAAERSLACCCLAKTLLQLENVLRVSVLTPESNAPLILTESDMLLKDTAMLPQEETVTLYLPDAQRRYLTGETQTVEVMGAEQKARFILEQLLQANPCIPVGTQLLDVAVEGGVCTVDLSSDFTQHAGFSAERLSVYSLVDSLTELPEITAVDLWIAGAPLERLGWLTFSGSLHRNESLIAVPTSDTTLDMTLYAACGNRKQLIAIPFVLETQEARPTAELLLHALLNFTGENGVRSCIPAGTKLLSLRTEHRNCIVDLTGEFLDGCTDAEEEQLAVRSVVATLCALPGIDSVELLVEGIEPSYRDAALLNVHSPQARWFAES